MGHSRKIKKKKKHFKGTAHWKRHRRLNAAHTHSQMVSINYENLTRMVTFPCHTQRTIMLRSIEVHRPCYQIHSKYRRFT